MAKLSAGLLLHRRTADQVEVLLVHPGGPFWARKDDGAWSVPKGEHGPDDDAHAAALREFAEELGTDPPASPRADLDLGEVRQKGGKVVRCWARPGDFDANAITSNTFEMEWPPRSGHLGTFPEVDRADWFDLDTARVKLLAGQVPFLDRLEAALDGPGDPTP